MVAALVEQYGKIVDIQRKSCKYLQGGQNMTNYREILRLNGLGLNKSEIAASLQCS